jgi:hypothetical protein
MGDSFGGVILAYEEAVQRVALTNTTRPWVYRSPGRVRHVVQTHDGTVFALETLESSAGITSAAIIALDGTTGALKARAPVTTRTTSAHLAVDCNVSYDILGEGAGVNLTDYALTTTGRYGILVLEGDSLYTWMASNGCDPANPISQGWHRTYLLTLDVNGTSTQTLLDEVNWSSGPDPGSDVSGLLPDARGNFVINRASANQVIGPGADGPALPIDENTIVSDADVHVAKVEGILTATDAISGNVLWSAMTQAEPVAFASEGRQAVLVRDGTTLFEVGPEAAAGTSVLAGTSPVLLAHYGSGRYSYVTGSNFVQTHAAESRSPFRARRAGNKQRQGTQVAFAVPVWVPDDPYPDEPQLKEEDTRAAIASGLQGTDVRLDLTVREKATAQAFITAIAREQPVFALISHFSLHSVGQPSAIQATGLCLDDFTILSPAGELAFLQGACYPERPVTRRSRIDVGSRVLFVAGCEAGELMKNLLGITTTTPGRALVFAKTTAPRLHASAAALGHILRFWRSGNRTIRQAVEDANALIRSGIFVANPYGPLEQYDVIGDETVRAPK